MAFALPDIPVPQGLEAFQEPPPAEAIVENEDGSYDMPGMEEEEPFDANLAESLDEDYANSLAQDLIQDFENDKTSRKDWDETLKKGLEILGLKLEEVNDPFPGACAAHHPVLLEAILQFQARAISELFPVEGPVKTKIMGAYSPQRISQAARVKEFMNYQLTVEMEEYFEDKDQMLFMVPLSGSAFTKVYFDDTIGRPRAPYINVDDLVVSYHTNDIRTAPRVTHVLHISTNEMAKKMALGYYRDIELQAPVSNTPDGIKAEIDKIQGISNVALDDKDNEHTVLEMHVNLDLQGYEDPTGVALPYIVTVEKDSAKILSIYRNYAQDDERKRKIQWFVHHKFLPGPGFYGLSLVHILGNLQRTATALLRALVDAGSFANLPAGFKARGVRMPAGDTPLKWGEWREVEGYSDDIRKALMPNPTREPSQTLHHLLGTVVEDARRLGSVADLNVGDSNEEAPVGTTLALMEQGIKVMSAIHKRLYRSQTEEYQILARVNRDFLPEEYPYDVEGGSRKVFASDFDARIDVIPVSDPNVFSETQRIIRAQAELQIVTQFPNEHNRHEALRRMHEVLGTKKIDDILNPQRGPKIMDPATENFAMSQGRPVKAYQYQDHQSHMAVHQSLLMEAQMQAQTNPAMVQIAAQVQAHITEHNAHMARMMIEQMTGIPLPPPPDYDPNNPDKDDGYEIDPNMEAQIARVQAQAAQQRMQELQQMAQMQANQQAQQDPIVQIKMMEAQTKAQAVQIKGMEAQAKLQLEGQKVANEKDDQEKDRKLKAHEVNVQGNIERERIDVERERIDMQEKTARIQAAAKAKSASKSKGS